MAQTTPHHKYALVNRAARGRIDSLIQTRRNRGDSYASIAWWIGQRYGVRVTAEAVRTWYLRGVSDSDAA